MVWTHSNDIQIISRQIVSTYMIVEEVPQKKNPITYNIFFGSTSSTSAAKEEAPAAE